MGKLYLRRYMYKQDPELQTLSRFMQGGYESCVKSFFLPSISRILISVKLLIMIYLSLIFEILTFLKIFNEDWAVEMNE